MKDKIIACLSHSFLGSADWARMFVKSWNPIHLIANQVLRLTQCYRVKRWQKVTYLQMLLKSFTSSASIEDGEE